MEIRDYEELKKKLCKQLEDMNNSGKFGMAEIEVIDKLTHAIKNIGKIMEMEGEAYSSDGGWRAEGDYSRGMSRYPHANNYSYGDESYATRRGTHYVRGHYSRAEEDMSSGIEEMLNNGSLSSEERSTLRRALEVIRK